MRNIIASFYIASHILAMSCITPLCFSLSRGLLITKGYVYVNACLREATKKCINGSAIKAFHPTPPTPTSSLVTVGTFSTN